jgi:serine/threonine-protein kinase
LTDEGRLKMLDFGIAAAPIQMADTDSHTRGLLGTPAYMAPEQARGRWDLVDRRSDLWSMAAVLFTLLTGEHVHPADTANEQLGFAMTLSARSIALALPELDAGIAAAIDRALDYDPAARFQSAAEFRQALAFPVAPDRESLPDPTVNATLRVVPSAPAFARGALSRAGQLSAPWLLCAGLALCSDGFHSKLASPPTSQVLAREPNTTEPAALIANEAAEAPRTREPRLAIEQALPQATSVAPLARLVKEPFPNRSTQLASGAATAPLPEPKSEPAMDLLPQASLPTFESIDPLDIRR